jgi:hypothetical protein
MNPAPCRITLRTSIKAAARSAAAARRTRAGCASWRVEPAQRAGKDAEPDQRTTAHSLTNRTADSVSRACTPILPARRSPVGQGLPASAGVSDVLLVASPGSRCIWSFGDLRAVGLLIVGQEGDLARPQRCGLVEEGGQCAGDGDGVTTAAWWQRERAVLAGRERARPAGSGIRAGSTPRAGPAEQLRGLSLLARGTVGGHALTHARI